MITLTLVAILGALLVLVLVRLAKNPAAQAAPKGAPANAPAMDLANLKPADARAGDVLSVAGVGDGMSDLDFTADRSTSIQAGARRWVELSGPYRERRVALRVGGGEEEEIFVQVDPRKITLDELGVSENDLAEIDERQNPADNFEFDNKVWMYRLSREAQARRSDQPQPIGFYYWEFREQNGPGLLGIRKLAGEPFAVTLFQAVNAGDVTIYRGAAA
jgi:hypothetical protein